MESELSKLDSQIQIQQDSVEAKDEEMRRIRDQINQVKSLEPGCSRMDIAWWCFVALWVSIIGQDSILPNRFKYVPDICYSYLV